MTSPDRSDSPAPEDDQVYGLLLHEPEDHRDLAKGVIAGVVMAALVFGWKISQISATSATRKDGVKVYTVSGQLFFGTMAAFVDLFAYEDDPLEVRIDLGRSHVRDQSAVAAITKVRERYRQQGKSIYVTGLNPESQRTLDNGFS